MKASEILHGLAELLAGIETGQGQAQQPNRAELVQVDVDNVDHHDSGVFVPPLQAKLELLKKSVGVENIYDAQGDDLTGHGDDLQRMKELSGINPTTQDELGSDEPLDV